MTIEFNRNLKMKRSPDSDFLELPNNRDSGVRGGALMNELHFRWTSPLLKGAFLGVFATLRLRFAARNTTNHFPPFATRKLFTSNQCTKASNHRLLVLFGLPNPKPCPPF